MTTDRRVLDDTILHECFRSYRFNKDRKRFETELYADEAFVKTMQAVAAQYGLSAAEMLDEIQHVLNDTDFENGFYLHDVCPLGNLMAYDTVLISHSGGQKLFLAWMREKIAVQPSCFLVVSDTIGLLAAGDRLEPVDYVLQAQCDALFHVVRNGKAYPSLDKLFRVKNIESIQARSCHAISKQKD